MPETMTVQKRTSEEKRLKAEQRARDAQEAAEVLHSMNRGAAVAHALRGPEGESILKVKLFSSGKVGFYANGKATIDGLNYQVSHIYTCIDTPPMSSAEMERGEA